MQIGYARVSTNEQNLDLQRDALRKAGVITQHIFTDTITGTKEDRPGLAQALSHLRLGDTLVVWRLDRLGRSLKHLIETVTALKQQGVAFKSITENIDTSTATGQLVFHIFGALAEFERNLINERTMAGLALQRHFSVLTKFSHVESRLSGRKRQREEVFLPPVNLCDRRACSASVAVGLEAARARGRKGGRPRLKSAAGKVAMAKKLYRDRTLTIPEICKTLHISKATLYRWVNAGGGNVAKP